MKKMLNIAKLSAFIREFQSLLPSEQAQFNLESNDEDIIAPLMAYLEEKFGQVKVKLSAFSFRKFKCKDEGTRLHLQKIIRKRFRCLAK